MRCTKIQVLSTISAIVRKYNKKYCVASQAKIIELLETYYKVAIGQRMLNYHLADLRKFGLIKTIKRTHRKSDGTLCLQTSATCLTPLGYYELWKLGCEWAKKMYDRLIKKYCPKIRANNKTEPQPQEEDLLRLRALGREVFKTEEYQRAFGLITD